MTVADGSGIGTIVQLGFAVADWANRGGGLSKKERRAIEAATNAGYSRRPYRGRAAYFTPSGQVTTERAVIRAGNQLIAAGPVTNMPGTITTVPDQGFVGPVPAPLPVPAPTTTPAPTVPDTLPRTLPSSVPGTVARVLARAAVLPWLIFYPSRTADDDTVPGPMPQPMPQRVPRGPTRRPRVRTVPRVPQLPDVWRPPQPRFPGDFDLPGPDTMPQTQPDARPQPTPTPTSWPTPTPTGWPRPSPTPRPTPAPRPPLWPYLLPYLPSPGTRSRPRVPTRQPTPTPTPTPATPTVPLTYFQPQPVTSPQPADPCQQTADRNRRRRKRDKCTNPITGKRTFTKGGRKFRSITRRLEC